MSVKTSLPFLLRWCRASRVEFGPGNSLVLAIARKFRCEGFVAVPLAGEKMNSSLLVYSSVNSPQGSTSININVTLEAAVK